MLPQFEQPQFEATIPSSKEVIHFRPFLVKEEKILLIAQQGGTMADLIRAIKQIIKACVIEDIDMSELTTFDIEYLFMKLRAKSVNNIATVSYEDHADGEIRSFDIDLDALEITFNEKNNPKIEITEKVGIIMKYPSAEVTDKIIEFEDEVKMMNFFVINSIKEIYDEDNVYPASDYSEEELLDWVDQLSVETFVKIKEFFDTMPRLYHKIEYTNKEGTLRTIEFNNLRDFFMWG